MRVSLTGTVEPAGSIGEWFERNSNTNNIDRVRATQRRARWRPPTRSSARASSRSSSTSRPPRFRRSSTPCSRLPRTTTTTTTTTTTRSLSFCAFCAIRSRGGRPPAASYRARLLKAFVLRLEETGTEVSDALADAHAALLLGRGGDDGDEKDDGAWGWRTFAYRARGGSHRHPPPPPPPPLPDDDDDGDDGDALTRALADAEVRAVSIRASRNLFEGGTGCHAWRAGFHLAEMIMRCVLSHTGSRTTASAW